MTNLNVLADRVEEAGGGDRELDAEIYALTPEAFDYQRVAIKLKDASRLERWHDGWVTVRGDKGEDDPYPEDLKRFTASLDAAMTLVPEGWLVDLSQDFASGGLWFCDLTSRHGTDDVGFVTTNGSVTPALALVSACLRARANGGSHG